MHSKIELAQNKMGVFLVSLKKNSDFPIYKVVDSLVVITTSLLWDIEDMKISIGHYNLPSQFAELLDEQPICFSDVLFICKYLVPAGNKKIMRLTLQLLFKIVL